MEDSMTDPLHVAYGAIDENHASASASTRRRLIQGAAASFGSLGLLGLVSRDAAMAQMAGNDPQTILNVAATAEVLATIVNTVGFERLGGKKRDQRRNRNPVAELLDLLDGQHDKSSKRLDAVTTRNIAAAAREELIHYDVLVSAGVGGVALTKRIWVPDEVFASPTNLLQTLEVGDQIFVNAYLIGTTAFGNAGQGTLARYTGEFMGVEGVHRALARQSLGKLGNDRVFMVYEFTDILEAVAQLKAAGFGFGEAGSKAGRFYDFDEVRKRTPNPDGLTGLTLS
jgi:hypothetical protein